MTDPYAVLGLPPDSDDEAIRRRYLELVRQFSPEHHPERFAAVRAAYESLRDLNTRLRYRLFAGGNDQVRPLLKTLVDLYDALALARRELQRVREATLPALAELAEPPPPAASPPGPSFLARLFGRGREQAVAEQPAAEAAGRAR